MPIGLINTAAETQQQTFANVTSFTTTGVTTVTGDTIFAAIAWGNSTIGTANTGDVTSISDSRSNVWHRIGTTFYTPATLAGHFGLAVFYSNITNGGAADTVSVTISTGSWNGANGQIKYAQVGYSNIFTPFFDAVSSGATGTGATLTANGVTTTLGYDALLLIGSQGNAAQTMPAPNTQWTQRVSGAGASLFFQEMPFVGQGYSIGTNAGFYSGFNVSPFAFQGTIGASEDWGAVVIAVPTTAYMGLAQSDTTETSTGIFYPYKELYFNGDIFLGGYTGLLWMKNVFILPRDYWDKALSTPYSGQLFPTGGNSGGPGQVFPF